MYVYFKPNATNRKDGQLVVLYDVERSSDGGEIEVPYDLYRSQDAKANLSVYASSFNSLIH